MLLNIKKYFIIGFIVVVIFGSFIFYFKWSQNKFIEYEKRITEISISLKTSQEEMVQMESNLKKAQELISNYNNQITTITNETVTLKKKISSMSSDLSDLAKTKPAEAQKIANEALFILLQKIEAITGLAPPVPLNQHLDEGKRND